MEQIKLITAALLCGALLIGCNDDKEISIATGSLNLSITDAPIDQATEVWVEFTGIELQPKDRQSIDIDFAAVQTINLLDLQGRNSTLLLNQHRLAAGEYNWMRLKVNAEPGIYDSYIELEGGGQHPLYIPSDNETGLKLNRPFTISQNRTTDLTIDFDLRRSIVVSGNDYMLKPTLRLLQTDTTGHISGTISAQALQHQDCAGLNDYAVYVYEGADATPDDMGGINAEPVTTTLVDAISYQYTLGFLNGGDYTIAYTCEANLDTLEVNETVRFISPSNVVVTPGKITPHNF